MTRKDYNAIAEALNMAHVQVTTKAAPTKAREHARALQHAAHNLAHVYQQENDRFDKQRFYDALGDWFKC